MFYLKIALHNIKKSKTIFAPFVLSSLVLFMLICSTQLIMLTPSLTTRSSSTMALGLGMTVLTIFSVILAIYSFSFLLNQRSREFGLYHILGMNKRKVSMIASLELIIMYLIVVVLGSLLSGVFANLIYLFFVKLVQYDDLHFTINPLAFVLTAMLFAGIFVLLLVLLAITIGKSSPLILFKQAEKGEKEPKGNAILAIISLVSLGAGYYLALTSTKVQALLLVYRFFIAVLLVIFGTYLFYISFTTWYLKKRRANKNYYYKPENFIRTSQMIFRMKKNALGLANITLLAVMSFVTIATTTSLYTDTIQKTEQIFPRNTSLTYYGISSREEAEKQIEEFIKPQLSESHKEQITYMTTMLGLPSSTEDNWTISSRFLADPESPNLTYAYLVTQDDFRKLGNDLPSLKDKEVAVYIPGQNWKLSQITLLDKVYQVSKNLSSATFPELYSTFNGAVIVVKDDQTLLDWQEIYNQYVADSLPPSNLSYQYRADLSKEELSNVRTLAKELTNTLEQQKLSGQESSEHIYIPNIDTRSEYKDDVIGFVGGFLFTGLLLGLSFLLGAALIIYYKQYSEGYEDKKSYKILQEVGMSHQTIKQTINAQTLMVFFLPLLMAVVHFSFAIVMLRQILLLFGVTSSQVVIMVSAITIIIMILIYYVIYYMTSKAYYRIVER